jgi:DNA-binding NtrC family response regulator
MTLSFDDATTRLLSNVDTLTPITSPRVSVTVTEGPDAGKRFDIDDLAHRQLLIGKSENCEVRLTDATASRRHVALELEDRGVVLRDLGSSNGTFVDNLLVREVILRGGETIRLGTTSLKLELGTERHTVPTSTDSSFGLFLGASPAIRRLYPRLEMLASLDTPLLIEGEAGTGKELLAEAIHERGPRKGAPYAVFDRGTAPPLEAEALLFGRDAAEPGGFSGPGILEQARGGTLFIDEIADLEMPLQLKLARALEKRSIRRLGGTEAISIDVRCIAATRRDLDREVTGRRFREELLQLFSAARVELPPLRRRRGDIALLTRVFWQKYGGDAASIPPETLQRFEEYAWPGNVRELANSVAKELVPDDVGPPPSRPGSEMSSDFIDVVVREGLSITQARQKVMVELDRRYVRHILDLHGGNIAKAAAAAGITRRYFYTLRAK